MDEKRNVWDSKIKLVFFDDEDEEDIVGNDKSTAGDATREEDIGQFNQTCAARVVLTEATTGALISDRGKVLRPENSSLQCAHSDDATFGDYATPRAVRGRTSAGACAYDSPVTHISSFTHSFSKPTYISSDSKTKRQQITTSLKSEDRELRTFQFEMLGARPKTTEVPVSLNTLARDDPGTQNIALQNLCKLTELCHGMTDLTTDTSRTNEVTQQGFSASSSFRWTRYQIASPSKVTASRRPPSIPVTSELCLVPVQPRYFMMAAQSDLSELQRLQVEALGSRPRSAVVSPRQSLSFRETSRNCNFCKRNGELPEYYSTHNLDEGGRITCPVLQRYVCPLCGATGEGAHTISYCPLSRSVSSTSVIRTRRQSCGCKKGHCKHAEGNR